MADNNSFVSGFSLSLQVKVTAVQVIVMVFLCINSLLIVTLFKKECFYTTTRYILFAVTLLSDSLLLVLSDVVLILSISRVAIQVWLCIITTSVLQIYVTVTPVTLTVMTLERFVAICLPLRHRELCSQRSTMHCILIIHCISSVPCIVILSTFFASAQLRVYKENRICVVEMFILYRWQDHIRSAIYQCFFLIMFIIIIICYVQIIRVARAASGENKKSTWKGLKTVILHSFQLLLCLIRLWCPLIEAAVLQINVRLFIEVRYFNYVIFNLTPRCLSPLIYGLRDESFFNALKKHSFFGWFKRNILRGNKRENV